MWHDREEQEAQVKTFRNACIHSILLCNNEAIGNSFTGICLVIPPGSLRVQFQLTGIPVSAKSVTRWSRGRACFSDLRRWQWK